MEEAGREGSHEPFSCTVPARGTHRTRKRFGLPLVQPTPKTEIPAENCCWFLIFFPFHNSEKGVKSGEFIICSLLRNRVALQQRSTVLHHHGFPTAHSPRGPCRALTPGDRGQKRARGQGSGGHGSALNSPVPGCCHRL